MTAWWLLLLVFLRIGLFTVGGGYSMIPLMRAELTARAWLSEAEFLDILAISEMTPGPIAINAATFIGYRTGGLAGALAATVGACLPGLLLILLLGGVTLRFRRHPWRKMAMALVLPVVSALLLYAALLMGHTVFIANQNIQTAGLDLPAALICGAVFWLSGRRIHPLALIGSAAICGILWCSLT